MSILVFIGLCAIALDISWYWATTLRMQRAADAAALAGVIHLPGDPTTAATVARAEAAKNGYVDGVGGTAITAIQDPSNPRRLKVSLAAPVSTFFARAFGIAAFPAVRDSKSEFVLPVPMGSPDAYYGVFGMLRHPGGGVTTTTSNPFVTGPLPPTAVPSTTWSTPLRPTRTRTASYSMSPTTNGSQQTWMTFGLDRRRRDPVRRDRSTASRSLVGALLSGSGATPPTAPCRRS